MRTLFERRHSVLVRRSVAAALLGGVALASAVALAEEPVAVSDELTPPPTVTQQTTTTTVVASPPVTVAPMQPVLAPPPIAPPPVMAPPMAAPVPMGPSVVNSGFQGAVYFNGPVWIVPAQPGYQPPMMQPQLPPPPVYVQPPVAPSHLYRRPIYLPPLRPYQRPIRSARTTPRGPVVGVGVRFTTLGITSQEVFGQKVNLMGGGLQLRFRNQGHWGFELGMDALRASIADNAFVRTSYPFSFSPMLYLRPNRPDNHFNIYAVAGFGLMADNITLYQDSVQERKQQFWEVLGQVGGGIEVRFTHLALFADMRAIGMLLDDSTQAGQYYQNVDGGPIPSSSCGYKANVGAIMWF